MKSKLKQNVPYIWLAPIITLAIMLLLYALAGIYPFGGRSTAFSDGINQYVPMLSELTRKIKSGSSLFFTWNMGGGANFWSNFTYYLTSPLNLIALLFKSSEMDKAFSLITLVKPSILALTYGIYLKYTYKKNDISLVIFSLLWAFSGFMISGCFFTSWYDAIIWFPLVIMGLKRLMDGESAWIYSLFLGFTILSNFYIGFMVCIFCVIYFVYLFIADDEVVYEGVTVPNAEEQDAENSDESSVNIFALFKNSYLLTTIFRFGFASLLGGALSAVLTLPAIYALGNTEKGKIVPRTIVFKDIWGLLASHVEPMPNIYNTLTSTDIMFCFAGLLTLVLCFAYFFSKGISVRKKIGNLFLLAVMWISIVFYAVYFVWHGFSEPAGIMYRFAFVYSFVLIKIAYEMFSEIEKASALGIGAGVLFTAVCIAGLYFNDVTNLYVWSWGLAAALFAYAIAFAILILVIKKNESARKILSILLTVLVAAECVALNIGHINSTDMSEVFDGREAVSSLLAESGKKDYDAVSFAAKDDNFYEMMMYGLSYGFRSYEIYSSMADGNFAITISDMGAYGNRLNSENGANELSPVFNLLFPTKYIIDGSGRLAENEFRKFVTEKDGYKLFENNYTMPFMYMLSGNIGLWQPFAFPVVVDGINNVFKNITDIDKTVAYYNANTDFVYENCEHISSLDKNELTTDKTADIEQNHTAADHVHEDGSNDDFWNYLENRMVDFAYRIKNPTELAYINYKSIAETDGIMYIYINTTEFTDMEITLNGKTVKYYTYGDGENRTYEIGEVKKGDVAEIRIGGRKADETGAYNSYVAQISSIAAVSYTIDMDVFCEGYAKIDAMSDTDILEFSDTYVKAKVTANENGALYIPIPYDAGWKVTVDGAETPIYEHESHIMMISLQQGEHIIEMKYCPKNFKLGAAVTGVSAAILIAWAVVSKKRKQESVVEK